MPFLKVRGSNPHTIAKNFKQKFMGLIETPMKQSTAAKLKDYLRQNLKNTPTVGDTFKIKVKRYFTDVDGAIIDKSAAPAALQLDYPVYLLGNFDRQGGNRIAQKVAPVPLTALFMGNFVYGYSAVPAFLLLSGFNELNAFLLPGDIITVYTDSYSAPSAFCWIVQSNDFAAVASFIQNSETKDKVKVGAINFIVSATSQPIAENQLRQTWHHSVAKVLGDYNDEQINPYIFKTPNYKLGDFVTIKVSFEVSQYHGINLYMNYTCDQMEFDLMLLK